MLEPTIKTDVESLKKALENMENLTSSIIVAALRAGLVKEFNAWKSTRKTLPSLKGVNLSELGYDRGSLEGVDFSEMNLSGANLVRSNLEGANLRHTNLSNAELRESKLCRADLSRANLFSANLRDANLTGACLRNADISQALISKFTHFSECNVVGLRYAYTKNLTPATVAYIEAAQRMTLVM